MSRPAGTPLGFVERGFGQVEPNKLTGIVTGAIEAQAPAYSKGSGSTFKPINILQNGMFLCVIPNADVTSPFGRIAVLPGEAPETAVPMLVFSERKQYDEREEYCDFVDVASEKTDGVLYPRLIGLTPDVCTWTTNTLDFAYEPASGDTPANLVVGDVLLINDSGYLTKKASSSNSYFNDANAQPCSNKVYQFEVTKIYTMPDGQRGVKVLCKNFVPPVTPTPTI